MSEKNATEQEIAEATQAIERGEAFGLPCFILLATPHGIQAIAAIAAAKASGQIRDLGHCKELAGDAAKLGEILGGPLAGVIAGETARCACDEVFSSGGGGGTTPPRCTQDGCRRI